MIRTAIIRAAALCALAGLAACASKQAAPPSTTTAADFAPNPLNLRRTTLVVRDIENALALYRDALGMTVEYDQELTSPNLGRAGSDGKNRSRLVLLKANDDYIGMLGLWQFLDRTDHDRKPPDAADFTPGDIVLLFNAENLDEAFAKAAKVRGVTVIGAPKLRKYPSPAGDIEVMVSMLVDPDGHTVELNRVLRDPRRR